MQASNFSGSVSRSNELGGELEKEVAPRILKDQEGLDPNAFSSAFIPDDDTGIEYDHVLGNGKVVFWVFKAGPRLNKTAFQKHLGELMFLKKHVPSSRCGMILGIGDVVSSGLVDYIKAYQSLWDVVYLVERKTGQWTYSSALSAQVDQTIKDVSKEILRRHLNQSIDLQQHDRFCSLPSLTGSSDIAVASRVFRRARDLAQKDLTKKLVSDCFRSLVKECEDLGIQSNELKSLEHGLTEDLIHFSIVDSIEFLCRDYPHYIICRPYVQRDWNRILEILKIGTGRGPAKYWDYYNPTAYLAEKIFRKAIQEKRFPVKRFFGCPRGYRIPSFFGDLGIGVGARRQYSEDIGIELANGDVVVVQAKSLAGGRGGSGPKQSGYEAHRMAGLSLAVMWSYDVRKGEILRKPIKKIVVLDGYWKGPRAYPGKSIEFMHRFAHAEKIFFVDEVTQISNGIAELTS